MTPEQRYVERMGAALTSAGLPRLPSRVYAALTVDEDGRMTAAELAAALAVSPASISSAVGFLSGIGFIHRERERGSRRDVFVVDDDGFHSAMMNKDQAYAPMFAALADAIAALPDDSAASARLRLMNEFLSFVSEEMTGIIERWEQRRAAAEPDLKR